MNRLEYMQELERLLADIPEEERIDAINYYNDYFDAGGEENEQETIAALGSPSQLASTIKLANTEAETIDGEFTETGYHDNLKSETHELDKYAQVDATVENDKPWWKRLFGSSNAVLIIILLVFASPILISLLAGAFSLIVGLLCGAFGVVVAVVSVLFGVGLALFVTGITGAALGIGSLGASPFGGITLFGISCIMMSGGIALLRAFVELIRKVIPVVFRWCVKVCKKVVEIIVGKKKSVQEKRL